MQSWCSVLSIWTEHFSIRRLCRLLRVAGNTFCIPEGPATPLSVEVVNLAQLGRPPGHIHVTMDHSQEGDVAVSQDRSPAKLSTQPLWFTDSMAFPKPLGNALGHWWFCKTYPHLQLQMLGLATITWWHLSQTYYNSALTLSWGSSRTLPPQSANSFLPESSKAHRAPKICDQHSQVIKSRARK